MGHGDTYFSLRPQMRACGAETPKIKMSREVRSFSPFFNISKNDRENIVPKPLHQQKNYA